MFMKILMFFYTISSWLSAFCHVCQHFILIASILHHIQNLNVPINFCYLLSEFWKEVHRGKIQLWPFSLIGYKQKLQSAFRFLSFKLEYCVKIATERRKIFAWSGKRQFLDNFAVSNWREIGKSSTVQFSSPNKLYYFTYLRRLLK